MNDIQSYGGGSSAPSLSMTSMKADGAVALAFQSREMVECLGMMQMAKMCPRDITVVRQRILEAAKNETLAVNAEYIYAKGGTEVTGLSIRAAEALAKAYGNIDFGLREMQNNEHETTCQAYCWDMETNTREADTFTVPKFRTKGVWQGNMRVGTERVKIEDQREIDEITRSRGSRIKRACILGVIPISIQEEFADACEKTLADKLQRMVNKKAEMIDETGTAKQYTIKDFIDEILNTLTDKYGVTRLMVCDRFQKKAETDLYNLDNRQIVMLIRILSGLRDGIATPSDYFKGASKERVVTMIGATGPSGAANPPGQKQSGAEKIKEKIASLKQQPPQAGTATAATAVKGK